MEEPDRNIFLFGEVTDELSEKIILQICKINDYDDEQELEKRKYVRKPINLYINSCGGYLYAGYSIISIIISSKTNVYTYALGTCMSAASDILMSGYIGHRTASKYTTICIHDMSIGVNGNNAQHKDRYKHVDQLRKVGIEFLKEYSTIPEIIMNDMIDNGRDIYLTPEEALEYGIIDEIV